MSTKRKLPSKLGHPVVKPSAKPALRDILDESRAVVLGGGKDGRSGANGVKEIVEISSDSSSDDGDEDEGDGEGAGVEINEDDSLQTRKATRQQDDFDMEDTEAQEPTPEEQAGPSFGDLILANTSEPIDVAGAFADPDLKTLSDPQHKQLQPPSGASLGTVLSQALKTNDVSLLESCFHTQDIPTIRATIQRLASPLAGILLQKLAERLHRRPGRAGSLMVWVQWTLVTHGGYLATQADLVKKLAELNRVIDERARGLQSLLSLKGKLDMLEAQMQLRRGMREQHQSLNEDDEDAVIYVEGQDDDDSNSVEPSTASKADGVTFSRHGRASSASSSAISEEMPTTANGIIADSAASSEDEESDVSNLIDDEAEETDADSDDEDQVDHSDQDELEDEDESDDAAPARAAPPTKMQRVGGLFSSQRHAA